MIDVESKYKFRFCPAEIVDDLEVIHYGNTRYIPQLVGQIKNEGFVKPLGGLWTSPVNSDWGWKDWNAGEQYSECDEENSFVLKFLEGTKLLVINSLDDLLKLPMIESTYLRSDKYLDFELLAKVADGLWLTSKGMSETHLSRPINLYGWDCESVLIFNPICCKQI